MQPPLASKRSICPCATRAKYHYEMHRICDAVVFAHPRQGREMLLGLHCITDLWLLPLLEMRADNGNAVLEIAHLAP